MAQNDDTMSRNQAENAGDKSQSKQNNPGNFANDKKKASRAGKEGAKNQSAADKREGGQRSHSNQ